MQSSTNAIMQSANLYVYVMNNPIRFSDPTGLFAWNENDADMVNLRQGAINAGGTFSWDALSGMITMIVYGMTFTFDTRNDSNISGGHRTGFTARADFIYSTIVNEANEMLFLTGHKAFGGWAVGALHMTLFMFIGEGSDYWGTDNFAGNVRWGIQYATIGGTAVGRHLGGVINKTEDLAFGTKVYPMQHLHTGAGKVKQVFNSFNHFATHSSRSYGYNPFGNNSSTYLRGLLRSVNIRPTISDDFWAPGWNRPLIPASNFGGIRR
jgi:hypothetical protein